MISIEEKDRGRACATFSRGGDFLLREGVVIEHGGQGVAVPVASV